MAAQTPQNKTPQKIKSSEAPSSGPKFLRQLASGDQVGMRMWVDEKPGDKESKMHSSPYETVGYVIDGKAKLHCGGETIELAKGDSWFVPADVEHCYEILDSFTAVEATSPPSARS
ncbi:cupin domain-containing protein [Persicimonas caeni]|uniref:Cupin domain-containing protein n=1 Tax=Persicimonas caeni TaxID=2292766 RepID=A0A4Y6Q161_PERCE|nr:cupin domain-containing protein [Persicimonas caeni]QDG54252.1 cupin domain-containing protein [Persicimonas caeni]QED35473.1 cupin domain-containing protein [Persicimonas caeni]